MLHSTDIFVNMCSVNSTSGKKVVYFYEEFLNDVNCAGCKL
jgi:hypothetical protein